MKSIDECVSVDDCIHEIYRGFKEELPDCDDSLRKKVAIIVGTQIYNKCEDNCSLSFLIDNTRKWATPFKEYGFDSMDGLELFSELEKGLIKSFPEYLFPRMKTPVECLSTINAYLANSKPKQQE